MRSINRLRKIFEYFFKYCDLRLNLQPTSERHSGTHVPAWRRYRGGSYYQAQDDMLESLKQHLYNLSSSPSKVIRRKRHPRWASSIRQSARWGVMIPPSLSTQAIICEQDNSKAARYGVVREEIRLLKPS
jgi:hypothetical protein